MATGQQQQQQQQRSNNNNSANLRPPPAMNRQGGNAVNTGGMAPQNNTDFISFLNGNSQPNINQASGASSGPNANALNRLETIRQYYMQLSNNLRLITQQLQSTELTTSRRQALLMEQARANAAMQEFTEKILKPISASKQQHAQAQAQAQQQQQQRPPLAQMMQFAGRPQNQLKSSTPSSAPPSTFMPQAQMDQTGMHQMPQSAQGQRPVISNVNLYSQSGLGMIRPIINAAQPAGGNRPGTTVNLRPNSSLPIPSVPQSVTPMPVGSPQRTFRPATGSVSVPISQLNVPVNAQNTSPTMPGTPNTMKLSQQQQSQQQQFIVNRQTYLIAAQQHQTSVAQQQALFQQRLSLFSRDPVVINQSKTIKGKRRGPVLALPPVSQINRPISSPLRGKIQSFPSSTTTPFSSTSTRTTSFPSSYPIGAKLKDLAKQFKLELDEGAEQFLLKIADEFIECLASKSVSFAAHRMSSKRKTTVNVTANKSKRASVSAESVDEAMELNVSVEDLMLGLDELINYQPAGNGSMENCRPMVKRVKEASVTSTTENPSNNSTNTTAISNHQHRLTAVKKHSSLYQQYY